MDYEAKLKCKRAQCAGALTIPIRIMIKQESAIILTQCPKCRNKYRVMFPLPEQEHWLSLIEDLFNRCENCGMVIPYEWKKYQVSASRGYYLMHSNIKVSNSCPNCKRNGPKSIDEYIWSLFKSKSKPPPKIPVAPATSTNIFCVYCGSALTPHALFCHECGSKTDED